MLLHTGPKKALSMPSMLLLWQAAYCKNAAAISTERPVEARHVACASLKRINLEFFDFFSSFFFVSFAFWQMSKYFVDQREATPLPPSFLLPANYRQFACRRLQNKRARFFLFFLFFILSAGISGTKCVIINTKIKTKAEQNRKRREKLTEAASAASAATDEMETRRRAMQVNRIRCNCLTFCL